MANPVLTPKRVNAAAAELDPGWAAPLSTSPSADGAPPTRAPADQLMSANGTFAKTFLLWLGLLVGGVFGWSRVTVDALGAPKLPGWILIVLLGALALAMVCIFKPNLARIAAPLYSLTEGVFLGAISHLYEAQWNGIVVQAILATIAVFIVCLTLYVTGAVKVTNKFMFVVFAATAGIFVLYFASFLLSVFGVDLAFWNQPSPLGIGFSVVVCIVASLNLFVDFEFIRRMVAAGSPKQMEWYGAFGITITIVWLYMEILRLLSLLRR